MILTEQLLAFHQSRHGQVGGKTVSNVLQAFPIGSLLWIHDDVAAKRTVRLGFGLKPADETVATQEMTAWEQLGVSEHFMTHWTFLDIGFHWD